MVWFGSFDLGADFNLSLAPFVLAKFDLAT